MKKMYLYSSLILALAFLWSGCDTNENLVQQRGVAVVPALEASPAFFTDDFDNSSIQFNASIPTEKQVESAELRVGFGGRSARVQTITSFPLEVNLTAREAMNALGLTDNDVDVVTNNTFTFYILTTSNGITTYSRAATVRALVTCEFNPELTEGHFRIVSGAWGMDAFVTLAADPDNRYRILISGLFEAEGGEPNDNVVVLNINPASFEVSGPRSTLGGYAPFATPANQAAWGAYHWTPTSGVFRTCTGVFEITVSVTVDAGGFGSFPFVLTRGTPPPPPVFDFSAEIEFEGRWTDGSGDFAQGEVELGADVDHALVAVIVGELDEVGVVALKEDIVDGTIESVLVEESGTVRVPFGSEAGMHTFIVVTFDNNEEAQEIVFTVFEFPPVEEEEE
jgi:hypothetical protein